MEQPVPATGISHALPPHRTFLLCYAMLPSVLSSPSACFMFDAHSVEYACCKAKLVPLIQGEGPWVGRFRPLSLVYNCLRELNRGITGAWKGRRFHCAGRGWVPGWFKD
eukprot:1153277-Pelagomonas_calceolata.AAC.8